MKVVFRTDASIQIGTGHVMRCITLADALRFHGANCEFICRKHSGNLIELIRSKDYVVHSLSMGESMDRDLAHSAWLGAGQLEDIEACKPLLNKLQPDWIVVDHYALNSCWEKSMAMHCNKVMVIDDLADRTHDCDVLLDQNFERVKEDYDSLVPNDCTLLCGSSYALLRPEFSEFRPYSLRRRVKPNLEKLLINFGGIDQNNYTQKVLASMLKSNLPPEIKITIILGSNAPWLSQVQKTAEVMPWETSVRVDERNIAKLMADSDLAISSLGMSAWERACLGLPSLVKTIADNQTRVANKVCSVGAAQFLNIGEIGHQLHNLSPEILNALSDKSSKITDGLGVERVIKEFV